MDRALTANLDADMCTRSREAMGLDRRVPTVSHCVVASAPSGQPQAVLDDQIGPCPHPCRARERRSCWTGLRPFRPRRTDRANRSAPNRLRAFAIFDHPARGAAHVVPVRMSRPFQPAADWFPTRPVPSRSCWQSAVWRTSGSASAGSRRPAATGLGPSPRPPGLAAPAVEDLQGSSGRPRHR